RENADLHSEFRVTRYIWAFADEYRSAKKADILGNFWSGLSAGLKIYDTINPTGRRITPRGPTVAPQLPIQKLTAGPIAVIGKSHPQSISPVAPSRSRLALPPLTAGPIGIIGDSRPRCISPDAGPSRPRSPKPVAGRPRPRTPPPVAGPSRPRTKITSENNLDRSPSPKTKRRVPVPGVMIPWRPQATCSLPVDESTMSKGGEEDEDEEEDEEERKTDGK